MTVIDGIIVAVIAVYLLLGLRRGFIRMVVSCIGGLAAYFAASYGAGRFAGTVSEMLIVPHLKETIADSIRDSGGEAATAVELWDAQSEYLRGLLVKGGTTEEVLAAAENPIDRIAEAIAAAVGHAIAYVVLFLLLFLLCSLVIRLLGSVLDLVASLPVLGSFNTLLGGLLGALFGVVLCTIVLWTLKLFVPAVYSDYGMLPPSMMQDSPIAAALVGWNDGVSLYDQDIAG